MDLTERTASYLRGLESAARKRKQKLTHSVSAGEIFVAYKWHSEAKGVGRMLYDARTSRVFILERSAGRGESVLAEANRMFDSFSTHSELIPWAVFGFEVRLPDDLELEKFKFLTGRITLQFKGKGIALTAERWGLASSILEKHDIVEWARALVGDGEAYCTPYSISLSLPPRVPWGRKTEARIRHDAEGNRLLVMKAVHRNRPLPEEWLP